MTTFQRPLENSGPIKMAYLGHTGAGKTGSTIALAAMGYKVFHLSFDGPPEILSDFIHNPNSIYRKPRPGLWTQELADSLPDRIRFELCLEGHNLIGNRPVPKGDSWQKANLLLNNWVDSETKEKLGSLTSWGSDTILVIDSFSRMCEAMMNFRLALTGRLVSGPQVGTYDDNDYSIVYRNILDFLDFIKCGEVKCHVILICHIDFVDISNRSRDPSDKATPMDIRGFPQTIGSGRRVSPKVGQYFNHALRAKSSGTFPMIRREIVTNSDENVELKTTAPLKVKRSYPLETGLAEYFLAIRGPLNPGDSK